MRAFISAVYILSLFLAVPAKAFAAEPLPRTEDVFQNELISAKTPEAAAVLFDGQNIEYLYYTKKDSMPDNNSLFQIGSLSKAFTGLGVLLLEEQGLLDLEAPVSDYLPWFTVVFKGETVAPEEFTVANLLYHTSGFTNNEEVYPPAEKWESLEDYIRRLSGGELAFYPSLQFSYANANYRILGLIIETLTGQSYSAFMTENIFKPLGLNNTHANPEDALSADNVVKGKRLSFFNTWTYDTTVSIGNVPSGYIYSNARDMGRWLQIQMGLTDIPAEIARAVEKSHQPYDNQEASEGVSYAAGWYVNSETGDIYHSGGTRNYSAHAIFNPAGQTAVCVLTNMNASANTDNIASNLLNTLEGQPIQPVKTDIWYIIDLIFSIITVVTFIGICFYVFKMFGIIRKKRGHQARIAFLVIPVTLTIVTTAAAVVMPIAFASSWSYIAIWAPVSLTAGVLSLAVLSVISIIVLLMDRRPAKKRVY